MIFLTVGTHEQPFNRLVKYIDEMKRDGLIDEEVVMQTGYSTYETKYCTWQKLYPYQDIVKYIKEARIVITHGGPSSFIAPLQIGKIPIVVPRKHKFGEHVNNHQVDFCREVERRQGNIIFVEDVNDLKDILLEYRNLTTKMQYNDKSNNENFCREIDKIVEGIFTK